MIKSVTTNLRKLWLSAAMLLVAGMFAAAAGQVRVSPTPHPNPKFKVIQPETKFDARLAQAALERGTSTIKGQVCSASNGQFYLAVNTPVTLFPMTPYFEEWYKLREEKEDKNTAVRMSDEALKYRIDTQTNEKAEFQFTEMKPGRYFIFAVNEYTEYTNRSVHAGTVRGVYGSADVYENRTYAADKKKRIEKIVELTGDQKIEKINLRSGFAGLINIGSCRRRTLLR